MSNGLLPTGSASNAYQPTIVQPAIYSGGGASAVAGWKGVVSGSFNPAIYTPGTATAYAETQDFFWDFYFRIWVLPQTMETRNPRTGVPIPFAVWNAYPYRNNLESITTLSADGLELDITPPSLFREIEYRTINLTLLPTAPISIDATFTFNFQRGSNFFHFIATRSTSISIVPEVPVKETWKWKTDITTATDGTEQRIGLRGVPRRYLENKLIVTSIPKVRDYIKKMMFDFGGQVLMPYFQYATTTTADSALGSTTLYFDSAVTDVRDGEFAIIIVITTQGETTVKINTLGDHSSVIDTPLDLDVPAGSLLVPAYPSLITSKPGMMEYAVDGAAEMTLNSMVLQTRDVFPRPGNTVVVATFETLPVLEPRPLAPSNQVNTSVDTGTELIDYEVGTIQFQNFWKHAQIEGPRSFLVDRLANSDDLDYWRNFLDIARGRLNPFLMPTYREDAVLAVAPVFAATTLTLVGSDFATLYATMETHKRLCLFTAAGPLYYRVTYAALDVDGNSVVTIDRPYSSTVGSTTVNRVSFLLKCRLASDDVRLDHHHTNSVLNLSIRTTDQ